MWHQNREAVMFMIGFGVVAVLALLGLLINALGAPEMPSAKRERPHDEHEEGLLP